MTKKEKLVDLLRQDARLSNEQLAAMLDLQTSHGT